MARSPFPTFSARSCRARQGPRLLIVGGQQRLTSLYALITGSKIVKEDYSEGNGAVLATAARTGAAYRNFAC